MQITLVKHYYRGDTDRLLIGRIHGAIVTATGRTDRRDDCPVYTLQAIVAVTIASWLLD